MTRTAFFLLLLIIASLGCQKEDEANPVNEQEQQLIGAWEGVLRQVGYPDFTIQVAITAVKKGEKAGEGSYSNPPCTFTWAYRSNQNDLFEFFETVTTPNSDCVNGRVTLRFIDDDQLQVNWYGVDHPDNQAEGVLRRR